MSPAIIFTQDKKELTLSAVALVTILPEAEGKPIKLWTKSAEGAASVESPADKRKSEDRPSVVSGLGSNSEKLNFMLSF
jgi:hypothetical protein